MKRRSAVILVVCALAPLVACAQLAGFRDIEVVGESPTSEASTPDVLATDGTTTTPDTSTTDGGKVDASDAADASDGADALTCEAGTLAVANCDGGNGKLVVHLFSDTASTPDHQGVMAVAGGVPNAAMGPNPTVWNAEKLKTWYTLDNFISSAASVETVVSVCVPPGNYTLQYWDIWGGGGGTNNGTPPTVTYLWQIGNSSEVVTVTAGAASEVTLQCIHDSVSANVPTTGSFYGAWATWDYRACDSCGACPSNATCSNNKCIDLGYDVTNCGVAGTACAGKNCCKNGCVDTAISPTNCGGCGIKCADGHACAAGQCQ